MKLKLKEFFHREIMRKISTTLGEDKQFYIYIQKGKE